MTHAYRIVRGRTILAEAIGYTWMEAAQLARQTFGPGIALATFRYGLRPVCGDCGSDPNKCGCYDPDGP